MRTAIRLRASLLSCLAALAVSLSASAASPTATSQALDTPALNLQQLDTLNSILPALTRNRVIIVGETHSAYSHHLNQLEIVREMHRRHPDMAIGMEYFQWPFQNIIDQYIAGEIDEPTLLRNSEYFDRWRFDYRMYRPIMEYARNNRIPVVALNVPAELTRKIAVKGLAGLSDEERSQLPAQIDRADEAYRKRLRTVYDAHPRHEHSNFEHFLDAQLAWDEGMSQRAADYLQQHSGRKMVILAGNGHTVRSAIPARLARKAGIGSAIIINGADSVIDPEQADFVLLPKERSLPPRGLIGALLEESDKGLTVFQLEKNSPAVAAGMKKGDIIGSIDNTRIENLTDLRIAMLDKSAGETVKLDLIRHRLVLGERHLSVEFKLADPEIFTSGESVHP